MPMPPLTRKSSTADTTSAHSSCHARAALKSAACGSSVATVTRLIWYSGNMNPT